MKSLLQTRSSAVERADAAPRLLQVESRPGTGDGLRYLVEYPAGAALPDELAALPRYDAVREAPGNMRWLTWLLLAFGAPLVVVGFTSRQIGWTGLAGILAGALWLVLNLGSLGWRPEPSDAGRAVILHALPADAKTPLWYRIRQWVGRVPVDLLIGGAGFLWFTEGASVAWLAVYAAFTAAGALQLAGGAEPEDAEPVPAKRSALRGWIRRAGDALSLAASAGAGAVMLYGFEHSLPRWLTATVVAALTIRAVRKHLRDEPVASPVA